MDMSYEKHTKRGGWGRKMEKNEEMSLKNHS